MDKRIVRWKEVAPVILNEEIKRKVCISENSKDGNYYIWPFVTFGFSVATLPIKILKISDTSDEALFEAAVEMMDYCRLPTIEEIEECEIIGGWGETLDEAVGFKKITGKSITWFQKNCPSLDLQKYNDDRYGFILFNPFREYFCSKDTTLKEKAAMLREVLNQW